MKKLNESQATKDSEQVSKDVKNQKKTSKFGNQKEVEETEQDLENPNPYNQEPVKLDNTPQDPKTQSYEVGLSNKAKNQSLLVRKRRRIDPNGGQRPCFCFYEDYDQDFLSDISSNTLKQVRESKHHQGQDFYYQENEAHYGYHYLGYYYGPICPCFQMCECCKNMVSKNAERIGLTSNGDQMCCCGLFNQADTCCKMIVDAWFYLICLPFRIIIESYKSVFRVCCGGESIGGSLSQATCFDQCCYSVYGAFSACWNCFSNTATQACQPCCQGINSCLGTACMQTLMACGGVCFQASIRFLSIPFQFVILMCTSMCQKIIVPCCECMVRNGDICCEIFRCLG